MSVKAPSTPGFRAAEMISVDPHTDQIACDGGGGPLGHPLVYYTFDGQDSVECGYCDRVFVKRTKTSSLPV